MREKEDNLSRKEALEQMIAEAQKMPGIVDLMKVYGNFDTVVLKSQEYLNAFKAKPTSTVSNSSS